VSMGKAGPGNSQTPKPSRWQSFNWVATLDQARWEMFTPPRTLSDGFAVALHPIYYDCYAVNE
jgi:hypothetical protein